MRLYMLLQVLGAFKRLLAEVAFMRLQRDMHTNVRRDMITFHSSGMARTPSTGQVEVVCALAPNMALTNVVLWIQLANATNATKNDKSRGRWPTRTVKC
jgi:hypothetical protein